MQKLGDFQVEEKLGRGSFKTVFRARNLAFGKNGYAEHVAMFVPHTQDEQALRHEVATAAPLDHPGIARLLGVERDGETLYAIGELVEGETVAERLKRSGPFALAEAVALTRQAADAIDHAHEALVFHRDIKPANIKLAPDDAIPGRIRVKLLDFGLARFLAHSQDLASTRAGSVAYMAPEQIEGAAGINADVWALGVTFFQMVCNVLPFAASDEAALMRKILYEPPELRPLEEAGGDVRLSGVVRRALEKDPDKRYRRAGEFATDLEAVLRHAAAVSPLEGELEILLRARYPLLFIVSHEEDRVLLSLERVRQVLAAKQRMGLFVWSETTGLRDQVSGQSVGGTSTDPIQALREVIDKPEQDAIYVMLDMHRHFTPVSVRLTRDAIWTIRGQRKSLVFVSPVAALPPELEKDATLLHFPPPDSNSLCEIVTKVHRELVGQAVLDGEVRDRFVRALIGLTAKEAERVLRRTAHEHGKLDGDCVASMAREKQQIVRKSGVLEFCTPDIGFDDIGGLESLKEWFAERREAFSPRGARFGLSPPKGVVLAGVPGCGKSLSAKALARAWGAPLLRMDMGRLRASRVGESEGRLRSALQTAELASPCILWIDELEKAFGGLGHALDGGVSQRLFGQFLTWLEDRAAPVFVVATANDVTRLPPEFGRKGRFDETFFVGLPNAEERAAIWKVHLKRPRVLAKDIDVGRLVKASTGYSGSEIAEVVVSAMYQAFGQKEREVSQTDLEGSLAEIVPLSRSHADLIERMRVWGARHARPAGRPQKAA